VHPASKAPVHPASKAPVHPASKAPVHPASKAPAHATCNMSTHPARTCSTGLKCVQKHPGADGECKKPCNEKYHCPANFQCVPDSSVGGPIPGEGFCEKLAPHKTLHPVLPHKTALPVHPVLPHKTALPVHPVLPHKTALPVHPVLPAHELSPLGSFAALSMGGGECAKVSDEHGVAHLCTVTTGTLECLSNFQNRSEVICMFEDKPGNCTTENPCTIRFPSASAAPHLAPGQYVAPGQYPVPHRVLPGHAVPAASYHAASDTVQRVAQLPPRGR
jgi:hypothetical protein